jgi:putative ABC transport system permease protein
VRAPAQAFAQLTLLALGTAAAGALFVPLYRVALAPLPFPDSGRIVVMGAPLLRGEPPGIALNLNLHGVLTSASAFWPGLLTDRSTAYVVVAPDFFRTLGVKPLLGHAPQRPGKDCVVSERYWRSRMGGDVRVSGLTVPLAAGGLGACTVTGVIPRAMGLPAGADVWALAGRSRAGLGLPVVIGRLRSGVSRGVAASALERASQQRTGQQWVHPGGPMIRSLRSYLEGARAPLAAAAWGLGLLFLLLTCIGVVNLNLARAARRQGEMAVRAALGASRARLLRQALFESLILAVAAGALGLGLAEAGLTVLQHYLPPAWKPVAGASPAAVLAVAALVPLVAVFCGIPPVWRASGIEPIAWLRSGGAEAGAVMRGGWRAPRALAATQLALALCFLTGTALLGRSVAKRLSLRPGFQPGRVAVVRTIVPPPAVLLAAGADMQRRRNSDPRHRPDQDPAFMAGERLWAQKASAEFHSGQLALESLPGVLSVSAALPAPLDPGSARARISTADLNHTPEAPWVKGELRSFYHGAFAALGQPLLAGRDFRAGESGTVAIVSQALAKRFFSHRSPLGREVWCLGTFRRIVGVVADIRDDADDPARVVLTLYRPLTNMSVMDYVVRLSSGAPHAAFTASAAATLGRVDPSAGPPSIAFLGDEAGKPWQRQRYATGLLGTLSSLALLVACLAVFASAVQEAAARRREFGVRLAIGARRRQILALELRQSAGLLFAAVPLGALLAWALGLALSHELYGVSPADPASYAAAAAVLAVCALAAALVPALNAANADPAASLRQPG